MRCLHKTSFNALVEPQVPIADPHPIPCLDASDALAAHAWLPRTHGRRADLCVSGTRPAVSNTQGRSIFAKYFAGSIHYLLASVCLVYRLIWTGECGPTARRTL